MLTFTFPDPNIISATTSKQILSQSTVVQKSDRIFPPVLPQLSAISEFPQLPQISELTQHPVIFMNQTHGSNCAIISEYTTTTVLDTDAVLTTLPNLTLAVKTADCLPILLWHKSGIIGALHAGRQGTKQKILKKTLRLLQTQFAITKGVHLVFGPGICYDCHTIRLSLGVHFDLVGQNTAQALEVFAPENITIESSNRCTAHEPDFFHSYRRDGKGVAMNYSVICRKS